MTNVLLPALGDGIEKATVTFWFFKPGDAVKQNDNLVELTTDKAAFNLPCPATGTLREVMCAEGAEVRVGEILAVIV
jgi:2-oxoglutarate dehydrogenase E2 component (dihydrolipoamide succinyltransferase)